MKTRLIGSEKHDGRVRLRSRHLVTDLKAQITELARRAKDATAPLAAASTEQKNRVLRRLARALREESAGAILEANRNDLQDGERAGLSGAMLDRLALDGGRLDKVAAAVDFVAQLPDPIGSVSELRRLENSLQVGRMRVPLGVVGMIYESRPNVTVEAGALCLKSGNAVILRGGKEAFRSNQALAQAFTDALRSEGLPEAAVSLVPTVDRKATEVLIGLTDLVDLVIPRGGEGLIRFVAENARVPVIRHYKGVCHVYVDGDADLAMAESIVVNAKAQRPGVCNALETLLVDERCAAEFLPRAAKALRAAGVSLRGDERAQSLAEGMGAASEADWGTEYLDLVLAIRVVDGFEGAIAHVRRYGSNHTESIVTRSYAKAQRWLREVDASCVLVNASTRFNDGGELGLGAEIGISTSKLHAYGPMGLEELCTFKWIAYGDGQIRK